MDIPTMDIGMICDDEDYISQLPESILGHILMRIPLKDAVKSCVLSKDWEYKWTCIHSLEISETGVYDLNEESRKKSLIFVKFMETISRHSLSCSVRSFVLSCYHSHDFSRVIEWLTPMLGPNLETLQLRHYDRCSVIPKRLLNCTSLKNLSLLSECIFRIPDVHVFLNLIDVNFYRVKILNGRCDCDTMILNFPVLESLKFEESKWFNVKFVEIHSPKLNTFVYNYTNFISTPHDYFIKLIGAKLSLFESRGCLRDKFILSGSSVDSATLFNVPPRTDSLHLPEEVRLQIRRLFNDLLNMRSLKFSCDLLEGFPLSTLGLSRYDKLERIQFLYSSHVGAILELLHAAPYLKFLEIEVRSLQNHEDWNNFDYEAIENVPHCIASSLEEVHFTYTYCSLESQFQLERFILKFGAQLKTIRFSTYNSLFNEGRIYWRLRRLPRASAQLSIEVKPFSSLHLQ